MTQPTDSPAPDSPASDSPASDSPLLRQGLIERLGRKLAYDYGDRFDADQVHATFQDSYDRLAKTARVTAFLPTLAERFTRERLDAFAQSKGLRGKRVPEVLFVCVHNAGRSQMAAAFARFYAGTHLHIRTGGSDPGERIQPEVSHAMKEVGLSLDEEFPKPLTDEVLSAADVVITMGCGDSCPYLPGRRYEDWAIADPAHADQNGIEAIRDDIDGRVRELLHSLIPHHHLPDLTPPALEQPETNQPDINPQS